LIHKTTRLFNYYPKNFKFVIFIQNCGFEFLKWNLRKFIQTQELSYIPGSLEIFEFLLINDGDFLHLATIEWFTEEACNQPQLNVLNSFNKITQKWTKKLENYEKFKNFHSCKLALGLNVDQQNGACWGTLISPNEKNNNYKIKGVGPKIFEILSTTLNFSPRFYAIDNNDYVVDVYLPVFRYEADALGLVHVTTTFAQARVVT